MSQIEALQHVLSLDNLENLARGGVQITHYPSYRRVSYVNPKIQFEPPCVVQAEMYFDGPLRVGAFSGLFGGRLRLTNVGRYCSIAAGIQTGWDDHPTDRLTSSMITYVEDVHGWATYCGFGQKMDASNRFRSVRGITEIGNDVWIGLNVFIRTGVRIGDGAIVAAGSIVTKDVEPYSIVAGNPAKKIRQRFDDLTCERLSRSKWWEYSIFDLPASLIQKPSDAIDWLNDAISYGRIEKYAPEAVNLI